MTDQIREPHDANNPVRKLRERVKSDSSLYTKYLETSLHQREVELNQREATLNQREKDLDQREKALRDQEERERRRKPLTNEEWDEGYQKLLDEQFDDMRKTIKELNVASELKQYVENSVVHYDLIDIKNGKYPIEEGKIKNIFSEIKWIGDYNAKHAIVNNELQMTPVREVTRKIEVKIKLDFGTIDITDQNWERIQKQVLDHVYPQIDKQTAKQLTSQAWKIQWEILQEADCNNSSYQTLKSLQGLPDMDGMDQVLEREWKNQEARRMRYFDDYLQRKVEDHHEDMKEGDRLKIIDTLMKIYNDQVEKKVWLD